mmetsp:Transcript_118484/g.307841  ORF Transcript_118484/g.307841 Transcript_118484/m.307841 type:complete len:227 (-) Transcript_118484:1465-2145(-)
MLCCRQTPTFSRDWLESSLTEAPSIMTSPEVGGKRPMIMPIMVDLPAPFSPSKPKMDPLHKLNDTPHKACLPSAYFLCKFCTDNVTSPCVSGKSTVSGWMLHIGFVSLSAVRTCLPSRGMQDARGKYQGCGKPKVPGETFSMYQASTWYIMASTTSIAHTSRKLSPSTGVLPPTCCGGGRAKFDHCKPGPWASHLSTTWKPMFIAVVENKQNMFLACQGSCSSILS